MDHKQFLADRKQGIGGSDIGAILGLSKFKSAVDVYLDKTTEQDEQTGDHLYWGHALENPIIDRFIQETGLNVLRQPAKKVHEKYTWAHANADGLIIENGQPVGILEIKTSSAFNLGEWGDENSDQVPFTYNTQVQWYMNIYGVDYAYLAVLIGGNSYRQFYIKRDQELIDIMMTRAETFWLNHVLALSPPEPQSAEDVLALFPNDDGQCLEADTQSLIALNELKELKTQEKQIKASISEQEKIIKMRLGGHSQLVIDGDDLLTWKQQTTNRLDMDRFKKEQPDLYKQYIKPSSSRVLRIK